MADKEQKRRGPYQRHSPFIRRQVAKEYHEGTKTLEELSLAYNIPSQSISRWVLAYRSALAEDNAYIESMTAEEQKQYEELRADNERLRRALEGKDQMLLMQTETLKKELEQARMQTKAMEAIIELASSELGIDLRKNSGARQPARLNKTTRRQK